LLASLATGATAEEAARVAGVGVTTVYRRLKDETFKARLVALKAQGLEAAVSVLGAAAGIASEHLQKLLNAKSETVQLGAARSIIELGLKMREAVEIEKRLLALENAALDGGSRPIPIRGTG
jgi:hypothetical protein